MAEQKQYVSDNAALMAEWNWEKNTTLGYDPATLTLGCHKQVWWKCSKGHEWQATIASRNTGRGCPICAGKQILKGYNDLQTLNPTLAKEWNYEKNGNLKPEDFTANSGQKVWWKCEKGHEWESIIANRSKGRDCPLCAGRQVLKGFNDLQTINPDLAKEWNYKKNNGLTPTDVMPNSNKKVWWICSKGHEWQATICNRTNGRSCPVCNSERHTSFPEYAIAYYLERHGLEVIHSYRECGYELDVYIPAKKIAVEYDGYFWHGDKTKKDLEKNRKCQKDGITLYRIREGIPSLNDTSIDYLVDQKKQNLQEVLEQLLSEIVGERILVDLKKDAIAIESLRELSEKQNSILFSNTQLVKEWNYEKNGKLKPEYFSINSNKKVWWKCPEGHEWQATISNRNIGTGCPYCSSNKVLKGYNDLATVNPFLAKEWNYEKNGDLTPADVMPNSGKKVWWKCSKGHEWQAIIQDRNKGSGCLICVGKQVLAGYNDLATRNPILAKEWNYEKNGSLTPADVMPNSGKKVWWRCSKGHEWQATIANRNKGTACPICAKEKYKNSPILFKN